MSLERTESQLAPRTRRSLFEKVALLYRTIFLIGAILSSAAMFHPRAATFAQEHPLLAFAWSGQIFLAIAAASLRSSSAGAVAVGSICMYKAFAATAMLAISTVGNLPPRRAILLASGAIVDAAMGALLAIAWRREARPNGARQGLLAPRACVPALVAGTAVAAGLLLVLGRVAPIGTEIDEASAANLSGEIVAVGFLLVASPRFPAPSLRALAMRAALAAAAGPLVWMTRYRLSSKLIVVYSTVAAMFLVSALLARRRKSG